MEAVLKNLGSTLEVLAVSETEFVREWDALTVDRAFQWAKYCEHIYTRFHTNPSIRPVLEDCLRLTNERLSEGLSGHRSLSLADLAQCRHRLFIGLLRNPVAPYSVIKSLFDHCRLFEDDGDTKPGTETDLGLSGLIMCRSACKLLGSFPVSPQEETSGISFSTQVQGLMVLQRIRAIQCHPGNDSYLKQLMDTVLQDAGDFDHLSEMIAASLLIEDKTNEEHTAAQDFLLDWLQEHHHSLLQTMCQSLPLHMCTKLSQNQKKFRLLYWKVLKTWASSMEYDVNGGVWVQQSDSLPSFKTLVDHLKSIWRSGSPLQEETENELVVLKQADGDFEVQGLSVWTDLLLQLR